MSVKTLERLKNVWMLDPSKEDEFESLEDTQVLKEGLKLRYFFQTHLRPQPFWGNIENPKVIVLGLNPSYDPMDDELDEESIKDDLMRNINEPKFRYNWFNHNVRNGGKLTSGYKFWTQTLGRLLTDEKLKCTEDQIYRMVGFFNFIGYHRSPFNPIQKKCFNNKDQILPTQKALYDHLKSIITNDTYIVLIWGYDYWKSTELFTHKAFDRSKLLIVNRNVGTNHVITNAHFHESKSPEKLDFSACLFEENKTSEEIHKSYEDYYFDLSKIIQSK